MSRKGRGSLEGRGREAGVGDLWIRDKGKELVGEPWNRGEGRDFRQCFARFYSVGRFRNCCGTVAKEVAFWEAVRGVSEVLEGKRTVWRSGMGFGSGLTKREQAPALHMAGVLRVVGFVEQVKARRVSAMFCVFLLC